MPTAQSVPTLAPLSLAVWSFREEKGGTREEKINAGTRALLAVWLAVQSVVRKNRACSRASTGALLSRDEFPAGR